MRVLTLLGFFSFLSSLLVGCAQKSSPSSNLNEGASLVIWPQVTSQFVVARNIEIFLPADYKSATEKRYGVVYMMDGQNLFSLEGSHWGKCWELDDSLQALPSEDPLRNFIVVGIHSVPTRFLEYCPQKPVQTLPIDSLATWRGGIDPQEVYSDAFLRFVVEELIPMVDDSLRTIRHRDERIMAGSSMGGLIALYGVMEYPEVFSGAACISTHWPLRIDADSELFPKAMQQYLANRLPEITHLPRLYFDFGTETLDAPYESHQLNVDALLDSLGYDSSLRKTLKFDGAAHDELAWREGMRAVNALRFASGH